MTSEAPYLHCRQCGVRYRSDKVADHERQCSNQSSNSRRSPRNLAAASSKDSKVNEFRDKEEYYMQGTRSKDSLETSRKEPKDLTSNEESDDSPFNMKNRIGTKVDEVRESREYSEKPTERRTRTETKTVRRERSGPGNETHESNNKTEVETSYDTTEDGERKTETKSYYGTDGKLIKTEKKTTYNDPESQERVDETETTTYDSSQSKQESPPNRSSKSIEKSANHRKSHSNEKTSASSKSPQKSNEDDKNTMEKTPYPSEEDIKMPSISADEVGEASDVLEHLPELSEKAEMALEKHNKALVPCSHCERMFRPDRLPIHERACIERPKAREYIVPEDKDKK